MKKKKIEAVPPIPVRGGHKKPYMAVAGIRDLDGQRHLLIDVYDREGRQVTRAAYTAGDWGLWLDRERWSAGTISCQGLGLSRVPVWDEHDRINGTGLPERASWSNTGIDQASKDLIREFVCDAVEGTGTYISPFFEDKWWYLLEKLEEKIGYERARRREEARAERLRARCMDMPPLPEGIKDWSDRTIFGSREYVYYKRRGRRADCQCSACGAEYTIITRRGPGIDGLLERVEPAPRADMSTVCEVCGASATYKPKGRARYAREETAPAYVLQPFRNGTVIRYLQIHKEWCLDCKSNIYYCETARVFCVDGKEMTDWNLAGRAGEDRWDDRNYRGLGLSWLKEGAVFPGNEEDWTTPELRHSGLKEFLRGAGIVTRPQGYLEAMKKFPMERIAKMGLFSIAGELVQGKTLGMDKGCSWGKVEDALGIRRCRLKLLSENDSVAMLKALQAENWSTRAALSGEAKGKGAWTEEQVMKARAMLIDLSYKNLLRHVSIEQLINRVEKWDGAEICVGNGVGNDGKAAQTAAIYRDYIDMRLGLGYDMARSTSVYPRDIRGAHRDMVLEAHVKENAIKAVRYETEFPEFKTQFRRLRAEYGYKSEGLFIRPAKTIMEVIEEGRILHHCVGASDRYIRRHAKGETAILFIRDCTDPNTPYITVEVAGDTVLQWYGRNDTKPDRDRITEFIRRWLDSVKKRRQRIGQAAKAAPQEAAQGVLAAAV